MLHDETLRLRRYGCSLLLTPFEEVAVTTPAAIHLRRGPGRRGGHGPLVTHCRGLELLGRPPVGAWCSPRLRPPPFSAHHLAELRLSLAQRLRVPSEGDRRPPGAAVLPDQEIAVRVLRPSCARAVWTTNTKTSALYVASADSPSRGDHVRPRRPENEMFKGRRCSQTCRYADASPRCACRPELGRRMHPTQREDPLRRRRARREILRDRHERCSSAGLTSRSAKSR